MFQHTHTSSLLFLFLIITLLTSIRTQSNTNPNVVYYVLSTSNQKLQSDYVKNSKVGFIRISNGKAQVLDFCDVCTSDVSPTIDRISFSCPTMGQTNCPNNLSSVQSEIMNVLEDSKFRFAYQNNQNPFRVTGVDNNSIMLSTMKPSWPPNSSGQSTPTTTSTNTNPANIDISGLTRQQQMDAALAFRSSQNRNPIFFPPNPDGNGPQNQNNANSTPNQTQVSNSNTRSQPSFPATPDQAMRITSPTIPSIIQRTQTSPVFQNRNSLPQSNSFLTGSALSLRQGIPPTRRIDSPFIKSFNSPTNFRGNNKSIHHRIFFSPIKNNVREIRGTRIQSHNFRTHGTQFWGHPGQKWY